MSCINTECICEPANRTAFVYGAGYGTGTGWDALFTPMVGGAGKPCCKSCAAGNGCESKMVGALTVSSEEVNQMQDEVLRFTSDVDKAEVLESENRAKNFAAAAAATACWNAGLTWDQANAKCVQMPDPTHQSFKNIPGAKWDLRQFRTEELTPFLQRWADFTTSFATSVAVSTFEQLKADFQALVETWTQTLGQTTEAVPPKVKAGGAFDAATEGFGKAAGKVAEVGTYIVVGGVLLLGLYYVAPVAARAAFRRKSS